MRPWVPREHVGAVKSDLVLSARLLEADPAAALAPPPPPPKPAKAPPSRPGRPLRPRS